MATRRTRKKNNVVSLRGAALPLPVVNADVVSCLEYLLDKALGGNVSGMGYATVSPQGHLDTGWAGNATTHDMIAGTAILANRVVRAGS